MCSLNFKFIENSKQTLQIVQWIYRYMIDIEIEIDINY